MICFIKKKAYFIKNCVIFNKKQFLIIPNFGAFVRTVRTEITLRRKFTTLYTEFKSGNEYNKSGNEYIPQTYHP